MRSVRFGLSMDDELKRDKVIEFEPNERGTSQQQKEKKNHLTLYSLLLRFKNWTKKSVRSYNRVDRFHAFHIIKNFCDILRPLA